MDTMIQLFAGYRETLEKQTMGFRMSSWDEKLLKYGARFEEEMMDLSVNKPLEQALDLGWHILADCFEPMETGIHSALIEKFWPKDQAAAKTETKDQSDSSDQTDQTDPAETEEQATTG
jgi:V/A-type H+-transporting ATPase subunit B